MNARKSPIVVTLTLKKKGIRKHWKMIDRMLAAGVAVRVVKEKR